MSTASIWRLRLFLASSVSLTSLLSSCSDTTPVSPTTEDPAPQAEDAPMLTRSNLVVGLRVGHTGWLRRDGRVAVRVAALCHPGYEVAESGPLSLRQRRGQEEASGEGFVLVQLGGCSGQWESAIVRVEQFEGPKFRPGPAQVSVTFEVVQSGDPGGIPHQATVVKEIRIRRVHPKP